MSSPPAMGAPALPAWKRALMERKRAKLAAGVDFKRGLEADAKPPPGSGTEREGGTAKERLVVAESLGPLRENPFMRLESERRRRRRRVLPSPPRPTFPSSSSSSAAAASSSSVEPPALAQLLELYSSVPGIRTIRADNILIIESREAELASAPIQKEEDCTDSPQRGQPASPSAPPPPPSSPCGRDPVRDLLSRHGSAVTEIRAAEVVIYEPEPTPPSPSSLDGSGGPESEPGRVSRLLQKFDRRPRGNVGRGRWRTGETTRPQPVVPNLSQEGTPALLSLAAHPGSPRNHPTGGFVQKIGSNSFTVNPRGCCPVSENPTPALSNGPVEPRVVAAPIPPAGRNQQAVTAPKPVPSPSAAAAASPPRANSWKPKLEGTSENPQLLAQQSSASLVNSAMACSARPPPLLCSNGSFEIRPAPRPDLAAIPSHDLQAQALASLRLNSRNSFLFVPCRKGEAPDTLRPTEVSPTLPGKVQPPAPEKRTESLVPVTYIDEDLVELDSSDLPPLKVLSPRLEGFDVLQEGDSSLGMEDLAVPIYRPHPHPSVDYATICEKGSNTFTIVPKRKPPSAALETFSRAQLPEEDEEEDEDSRAKARSNVAHEDLGQRLKKRYPTVNEIEVIGGYLSLDRSCMSKSGSRRKKMKISFNETSLQTMFEYPSESSLVEAEEEEEEEYATEVDEKPALFIPRPNSTPNSNAVNSGLSSYTPKHSVEFSKWQEQQYEEITPCTGAFPQDAALPGSQVMLTPADKSNLSDFGSEPALYF